MPKYQVQTDQITKITLPSAIQAVSWSRRAACPGAAVQLQIHTQYVSMGAEMKITIEDENGKTRPKYKAKLLGNPMNYPVIVPEKAKLGLYAEVNLPRHGLKQKSEKLIVLPVIDIKSLKWDRQEARRGDILTLTAETQNVPDGVEAAIEVWEHDAGQAHDLVTKFPATVKGNKIQAQWGFEHNSDTDGIPTQEEMQKIGKSYQPPAYFFVVDIYGKREKSDLLGFRDWVKIELMDESGSPVADANFAATLPNGDTIDGTADEKGHIMLDNIPPGKTKITVNPKKE